MDLNVPLVLSCELIGGGRLIRRPDEASCSCWPPQDSACCRRRVKTEHFLLDDPWPESMPGRSGQIIVPVGAPLPHRQAVRAQNGRISSLSQQIDSRSGGVQRSTSAWRTTGRGVEGSWKTACGQVSSR